MADALDQRRFPVIEISGSVDRLGLRGFHVAGPLGTGSSDGVGAVVAAFNKYPVIFFGLSFEFSDQSYQYIATTSNFGTISGMTRLDVRF